MRFALSLATLLLLALPAAGQSVTPPSTPVPPSAARPVASPPKSPALAKNQPPKLIPMQVVLVRAAIPGCEPQCPEWIAAQGDIDQTSVANFRRVLKAIGVRKVPILIDSSGGNVDAAFMIGRMIRAKGLDVAVTKTVFKPCAADDRACQKQLDRPVQSGAAVPGLPREYLSKCASSCAFILAAGTRRYVGPRTFVGVHQITTYQTQARVLRKYKVWVKRVWGVPVESRRELVSEQKLSETVVQLPTKDSTYTKIRKYFAEMGIADSIVTMLMETPASTLHVLTRSELVETRMATDLVDGQQLLTGVTTLRPGAAAAFAMPAVPPASVPQQTVPQPSTESGAAPAPPAGPPTLAARDGAPMASARAVTGDGAPAVAPMAPVEQPTAPQPKPPTASLAPAHTPAPPPAPVGSPANAQSIGEPSAAKAQRIAALTTPKPAEIRRRAAASSSAGRCACPEMTTCSGAWVNMTCDGLKALCRSASPLVYVRNGCGRLKDLVGF